MVYLCANNELGALKVGVGAPTNVRIIEHAKRGWTTLITVPVPGRIALAIEKEILDWWRNDLGLPPYLSQCEMPQNGWTETVDLDAIDIPATIDRIQELVRHFRYLSGLDSSHGIANSSTVISAG